METILRDLGAASPIHESDNSYLCKFLVLTEAYSIHTDYEEMLFLPTHSAHTLRHLNRCFCEDTVLSVINLTLIWLMLPFVAAYGTTSPDVNKRKLLFPHDETSLGITRISYQQLQRKKNQKP